MADVLKNWIMVALTLIFVSLYSAALMGWLRPLADVTMITRLEPIIFVIIGYYFGRLPAQANERSLKEEIDRQTKKTDASQHAKETAQKERDVMEEKIKNAKVALNESIRETDYVGQIELDQTIGSNSEKTGTVSMVNTAVQILDS